VMKRSLGIFLTLPLSFGTAMAAGSAKLVERTDEAGISYQNVCGAVEKIYIYETIGAGSAFFDYDADGDMDVYFVNGARSVPEPGPPNQLYRNEGGGKFREVTAESGAGDTGFGVAVAAADIDADGDIDLFLANNGPDVLLINQGDGTFRRGGPEYGIADNNMAGGTAFGDYDRDGLPDLYVSNYVDAAEFVEGGRGGAYCKWKGMTVGCGPRGLTGDPDRFYRNVEGRFEEVSRNVGITLSEASYGLGVLFVDLTADGLSDIYVANDSLANFFYVNVGDDTFSEEGLMRGVGYSGDGLEQAGMGVDAADVDGDGDYDLVVSNFSHDHTSLYLNRGNGFFTDVSYPSGIGKSTYFPLTWGARFVDLDSDAAVDLVLVNGHIYPNVAELAPETAYKAPNLVFMNQGDGTFREAPEVLGDGSEQYSSRGLASGDYDNDGRVDLLVTSIDGPAQLLHNESSSPGRSVLIHLVGVESSRDGQGATVRIKTGETVQVREVTPTGGYASVNDIRMHFGLGAAERIDSVEIQWPSGNRDLVDAPPISSILVIKQGVGLLAVQPLHR